MAATSTTVCNLALNEIPAAKITSLTDNSLNASHCAIAYPQALAELLEKADWGFATARVELAATTNDRTGEWGYAYAKPSDLALPIRLVSGLETIYAGDVPYGPVVVWTDPASLRPWDYTQASGLIYSSLTPAILEYVSDNPTVSNMPAYFVAALAAMVAARIVMPITKDLSRKRDAEATAQLAIATAIAANFNARQPTYGDDFIPSTTLARMGY